LPSARNSDVAHATQPRALGRSGVSKNQLIKARKKIIEPTALRGGGS
jgi:hypothetical protein